MIDIIALKAAVAARAEDFLHELHGDRLRRAGPRSWRIGKRGSLAISLLNDEVVFYDHERGEGGDAIDLWQRERGGDALRAVAGWAGIADDGTPVAPPPPRPPQPSKPNRPPSWPILDHEHDRLWRSGLNRLIEDAAMRDRIAAWRGWPADALIPLAKAHLISAPTFDLWPGVIEPQEVVAFRVLHPRRVADGAKTFWASVPAQLHLRAFPGTVGRDGSAITWLYSPTMRQLGVDDGGNAPMVITRNGRDPEQPGDGTRCECVIMTAGEWDSLTLLLAKWWTDDNGALLLPPGLAIVGIRGEGRGGVESYLRHYGHWRPHSVIMLADADSTGLSWFTSTNGKPCFAEHLERRGAKVFPRVPAGAKDVNDLYKAGRLGAGEVEELLREAGFTAKGGTL